MDSCNYPELRRQCRERKAYIAVIATQARSPSSLEMEGMNGVKAVECIRILSENYDRLSERNKYLRLSTSEKSRKMKS